jgi:hypothetical protein
MSGLQLMVKGKPVREMCKFCSLLKASSGFRVFPSGTRICPNCYSRKAARREERTA